MKNFITLMFCIFFSMFFPVTFVYAQQVDDVATSQPIETSECTPLPAKQEKTEENTFVTPEVVVYVYPTDGATALPTVAPTATPTADPTATPTVTPFITPAVTSSAAPTVTPFITPAVTSSAAPTVTPTPTPTSWDDDKVDYLLDKLDLLIFYCQVFGQCSKLILGVVWGMFICFLIFYMISRFY